MKIAILSTPTAALPPVGYAGIERVVYNLQRGLLKNGHEVTVFATGDSTIDAHLEYYYPTALKPSASLSYNPYFFLNHIYGFMKHIKEKKYDILHLNDAGRLSLYFSPYFPCRFVTTLHGTYAKKDDDPNGIREERRKQLLSFKSLPYTSISTMQRVHLPELNYLATVYNGVDMHDYPFNQSGGEALCWLGRVVPDKGFDMAIDVAKQLGKSLDSVGFIDPSQQEYFDTKIQPNLGATIQFTSDPKSEKDKAKFYGEKKALLFPIRWDEPFGIVMAEAMATGTPVVAFACGSVPEVVVDGITGFIVNPSDTDIRGTYIVKKTGIAGLREAVERIYGLSHEEYRTMRQQCRTHVEKTFSIEAMVQGYEAVYEKVLS